MRIQYIKQCTCPLCGSHEVEYYESEIDGSIMYYKCECTECNATWNEFYKLVFAGISEVIDYDDNEYSEEAQCK